MIEAYNLPEYIPVSAPFNGKENTSVFYYTSTTPTLRNRINLQQNMFSLLLEGEKSIYYAGKRTTIGANKFLLLSEGNCLMSEKMAAKSGGYSSILFFFSTEALADFFKKHPLSLRVNRNLTDEEPFIVFEKDIFINSFIDSLRVMLIDNKSMSAKMQAVKLEELLLYLSEKNPGQIQRLRNVGGEANDDRIIRNAVMATIDNPVTVEELAFLCHTSLSTFKRRFAKIYGSSPSRWLLEKRMEKAASLLRENKHKASEIYYDLGYENLSSFIQSFKLVHGVTPKQYQSSNFNA